MWELIAQNKRRSLMLFVLMGVTLIILGYLVGAAFAPPDGGAFGVFIAIMIWAVLSIVAYFNGDSIMLGIAGAKEIAPEVHPQLFNVVEEMKIAGSLPAMPKVYIIDSPAPNAFATGRKPENSTIAVTSGLLARLNRDELQGVVAHETGHILNRDILFMTFAGVMLGVTVIVAEVFLRGMFYSGSRRMGSSRSKNGGQGAAVIMVVAIVFAILAPIMARLLYFAISRRREYLADATAVRLTRYPEGLASALEKISNSTEDMPRMNKAIAPLFIVNPLKGEGKKLSDLTSTHPPISERIRILRSIAGGSGYLAYQDAFNKVKGRPDQLLPESALKDASPPIRSASAPSAQPTAERPKQRDVNDLLRAVNGFMFLTCQCGLKMKIPPEYNKSTITCPRCQTVNQVPVAELAAASAVLEGIGQGKSIGDSQSLPETATQSYTRKSKNWESFKCVCGHTLQLSPAFVGDRLKCPNCSRVTRIVSDPAA